MSDNIETQPLPKRKLTTWADMQPGDILYLDDLFPSSMDARTKLERAGKRVRSLSATSRGVFEVRLATSGPRSGSHVIYCVSKK